MSTTDYDDGAGAWVTGHNLAGYMPEADTYAYARWSDARDSLMSDMREYADADDDHAYDVLSMTADPADYPDHENSGYGDDEPAMLATVNSILRDNSPEPDQDWSARVEDSRGRSIVFWLTYEPSREPDEDDI